MEQRKKDKIQCTEKEIRATKTRQDWVLYDVELHWEKIGLKDIKEKFKVVFIENLIFRLIHKSFFYLLYLYRNS